MSESLRSEVAQPLIAECRARLAEGQQALVERYERTGNSRALLHGRSKLVDATLGRLWQGLDIPGELSLAAVGGYGRGELYPCSDVDLLLLIPAGFAPTSDPRVEQLIGMLWDVGLEVGHEPAADLRGVHQLVPSCSICRRGVLGSVARCRGAAPSSGIP